MKNIVKLWKITNCTFNDNIIDGQYLLNSLNLENNIEKCVYDISLFHMDNNNIDFNKSLHNIEFSIENPDNTFKIHYNRKNKKYPLLSIITFLEDNSNPIIFTDIDLESYKYKEISDDNELLCIKPRINTQIVFDSSKYFGFYKANEINGKILKINIWDIKLDHKLPMYTSNICTKYNLTYIEELQLDFVFENVFYKNIINSLLYEDLCKLHVLDNVIKKHAMNTMIVIKNVSSDYIDISILKEKYGDIAEDIYPFINKNSDILIDVEKNRFNRNKIVQNVLSKDVCYWIINECEKMEWNESKYSNYNTYINVKKIPSILNFLLFVSNFWLHEIKELYSCKNISLNITDVFVSKYTKNVISDAKTNDNSFLTLNIYLNDNINYKDGEIVFSNDITNGISSEKIMINQCDMLIYNGKLLRTNGNVSGGVKYILVFMLEIMP